MTRTRVLDTLAMAVGAALGVAAAHLVAAMHVTPERAAYARYATCVADMAEARDRWAAPGGKTWADPVTCHQPTITYADYLRAYDVTWADYGKGRP